MGIWTWVAAGSACGLALLILRKKQQRDAEVVKCKSKAQLKGQLAIVTGASSGLGREISLELVKRGCRVVMGCMTNVTKAKKAADYIRGKLGGMEPTVEILNLRLDSIDSVENFVRNVQSKWSRVDILVNNAGVMGCPYQTSADGVEMHFAVNHLGHFHLTNLLKPLLTKSPSGRVINVTSGKYLKAQPDWSWVEAKNTPKDYSGTQAYARSKLANCLHILELSQLWSDTDVKSVAVRPGFVRGTDLGRHFSALLQLLAYPIIWFVSKSLQQGVQTILHCCLDEGLVNGRLYANCAVEPYDEQLVNRVASIGLWELSEHLIEQVKSKSRPN